MFVILFFVTSFVSLLHNILPSDSPCPFHRELSVLFFVLFFRDQFSFYRGCESGHLSFFCVDVLSSVKK
jgi:hypothetical protein